MRKIKAVVFLFIAFLLCMPLAYADCDASESNKLSSLANNVRTSQEVIEKVVDPDPDWNTPDGLSDEELAEYVYKIKYFRIYISNITQDLYVVVTNNSTKESKTFNYQDSNNGTITFDEMVSSQIINYTVDIYASGQTNCSSKKLRTLYITTPKYNSLSEYASCEGIEEFYLCHEYLSVEVNVDNFESLTTQYREGKITADGSIKENGKKEEGFLGFIKEHKGVVIMTSVVIIAVGGLVTVIIVKKQRSRVV